MWILPQQPVRDGRCSCAALSAPVLPELSEDGGSGSSIHPMSCLQVSFLPHLHSCIDFGIVRIAVFLMQMNNTLGCNTIHDSSVSAVQ